MAAPASLSHPRFLILLCRFVLSLAFGAALPALGAWDPVSPEELSGNTPKVDPEAHAEILEWRATMNELTIDRELGDKYYVRAKIYTQEGVVLFSKVDIPYETYETVRWIEARTIQPDGKVLELDPKDIFTREIVKQDDERVEVVSFAPPGLVPGAILEYRYHVDRGGFMMIGAVKFQAHVPVVKTQTAIRLWMPRGMDHSKMRAVASNCDTVPLEKGPDDLNIFRMEKVPAFEDEPYQPPFLDRTKSVVLYFSEEKDSTPTVFWNKISKNLHKEFDTESQVTRTVRTKVAEIAGAGDTGEALLTKIYDYSRTQITNQTRKRWDPHSTRWEKAVHNETAADTLRRGKGSSREINIAFAALATAAGFETRLVACNNRGWLCFNPTVLGEHVMLPYQVIAVRLDGRWLYFDPGATFLPFGMLPYRITDTMALMSDKEGKGVPATIRGDSSQANMRSREAKLQLDEDGTVHGTVSETYTGQPEVIRKNSFEYRTTAEQEEYVRAEIRKHQSLAEVSQVVIDNVRDPLKPLKIAYHIRIPGYAERTGSRLFLRPAVFQKGVPVEFPSATRVSRIFFHYRYTSKDDIQIKIPAGYALEEASSPAGFGVAGLADYRASLAFKRSTTELLYQRTFQLTDLIFPVKSYPAIKAAFETVHERDAHTVALKRVASPVSEVNPQAAAHGLQSEEI